MGPVQHLQRIYSVVLGVAVGLGVERVLDTSKKGVPIRWSDFPLFLAFVIVAFGFYQISARYLDLAYERLAGRPEARVRIIRDVLLGATQVLLVVALGVLIGRPRTFAVTLLILFGINLAGVGALRLLGVELAPVERHAVPGDVVAVVGLGVVLLVTGLVVQSSRLDEAVLRAAVPVLAVGRMAWHYVRSLDDLYFSPRTDEET